MIPAWSVPRRGPHELGWPTGWPEVLTREWAWGGSTGAGVRVCVIDSGVEGDHPSVGPLHGSYAVLLRGDEIVVERDEPVDVAGHGTACASVVRALAPGCELYSVRVLGAGARGSGPVLLEGLRWAVEQGFDVINLSLSTTKSAFAEALRQLADTAYFRRTMIVAAAHNMPVESFPWRFSSVLSVGSHAGRDPFEFFYNAQPPVEFFARGIQVDVGWPGGGTLRVSGNSFATPHVAGICALVLGKHRELAPFQLKSVLYLTSSNVVGGSNGQ
jgi:subtilisin family serine protease